MTAMGSALVLAALAAVAQGRPVDSVSSEGTLYLEANEQGLQAEESWAMRNLGSVPVPAADLVIQLPPQITQIRAEGDASTGMEVGKDNRSLRGTAPLPPGETRTVTVRYMLPLASSTMELTRIAPFSVGRWRLIIEDQPGLALAASEKVVKSDRELNGVRFDIWELSEIVPGKVVTLTLSGLPVRSHLPQYIALVAGALVLAWAVRAVARSKSALSAKAGAQKTAAVVTPLSGVARRERLVRAVELLDADHAQGKLDAEQHARRRRALVGELAVVLRQIDLESTPRA